MLKELRAYARARGEDPAKVALKPWSLNDMRRTVRTRWSIVGVPEGHIVRQLMLALRLPELHQVYDQHAYFRERKSVLEEWAKRLKSIVAPESPALFSHHVRSPDNFLPILLQGRIRRSSH
jgi:hypothetical protein